MNLKEWLHQVTAQLARSSTIAGEERSLHGSMKSFNMVSITQSLTDKARFMLEQVPSRLSAEVEDFVDFTIADYRASGSCHIVCK